MVSALDPNMRDKIFVMVDGEEVGPVRCSIQRGKVFVAQDQPILSDGRIELVEEVELRREMSTMSDEHYVIRVSDFFQPTPPFPGHWELEVDKVAKSGSRVGRAAASSGISISNSTNVQVGDGNVMDFAEVFLDIADSISSSSASNADRATALNAMKAFLTNPVVAAVVGAGAQTAIKRYLGS